jgi:hypothetical protein
MLERAKRASHIDPPASSTPSCGGHAPTAERTLNPARMFTESLTSGPELENSLSHFRTHAMQPKPAFCSATQTGLFDPRALGQPVCVAIGAPLECLAHLTFADPTADAFRTVANITGDLMLVALFDCLRSLPEPGDGVTMVPRAEAFGGAVQDLAQPIPGTVPIIDPHES